MLQLLHKSAYRIGAWMQAVELGNLSYQSLPSYDTAVINSLAHAIMGEVQPSIG